MELIKHETCQEYFRRRLAEGWKCISFEEYNAVLLSPNSIRRELDLRNDVETLRPSADGTYTDLYPLGEGDHYVEVDEVGVDGDTTRVHKQTGEIWEKDTYVLPNSEVSGTINHVTVYACCKNHNMWVTDGWGKIIIRTHSNDYWGDIEVLNNVYLLYDKQWTKNPETTIDWTWAEIDALEVGIDLYSYNNPSYLRCTQVYVEVDYTPASFIRNLYGGGFAAANRFDKRGWS